MSHLSHDTSLELETQLRALINEGWEHEVVAHLPAEYEQSALALGAYQRQGKVRCVSDLLRALLAYVLCASSFREVGIWAVLIGLANISHVGWHKRLQRARPWLLWLLTQLLAVAPGASPSSSQAASRLIVIDATRVKEPGGCGDDWRAHLGYDLRHRRVLDVRLSDRHTAEGFTLFQWQPGDIGIADRVYSRRGEVAWMYEQGAYAVVRVAVHQFPLRDAQGHALDIGAWLRQQSTDTCSCPVHFLHQGRRFEGRLIARRLSPEAAERARAKVRRKASKQQREVKEETLWLAGWLLLFTSLPQQQCPDAYVFALYRARWQVELVIKRMKQILKLVQLRGCTVQTNEATLLAVLVCWALQHQEAQWARQVFAQAVEQLEEREGEPSPAGAAPSEGELMGTLTVSSWGLTVLCTQTLRLSVQGFWTPARLHACLPLLTRFVCSRRKRRPHQESEICQYVQDHLVCLPAASAPFFSCSGS